MPVVTWCIDPVWGLEGVVGLDCCRSPLHMGYVLCDRFRNIDGTYEKRTKHLSEFRPLKWGAVLPQP